MPNSIGLRPLFRRTATRCQGRCKADTSWSARAGGRDGATSAEDEAESEAQAGRRVDLTPVASPTVGMYVGASVCRTEGLKV